MGIVCMARFYTLLQSWVKQFCKIFYCLHCVTVMGTSTLIVELICVWKITSLYRILGREACEFEGLLRWYRYSALLLDDGKNAFDYCCCCYMSANMVSEKIKTRFTCLLLFVLCYIPEQRRVRVHYESCLLHLKWKRACFYLCGCVRHRDMTRWIGRFISR